MLLLPTTAATPRLPPRRAQRRRHSTTTCSSPSRRSNPTLCCMPADSQPLLAACLTRYSDVTLSRLAGDMFGCLPSHRPTSLFTKPQLLHPLLPVCCGAMGVPFDALYYIGMCTCTRLRSMTTTTITGPSYLTKQKAPCETCELGLNDPDNEKELEEDASKKKRNQAILGLTARDSVPFPNTPTPTQTFPSANAVAVDFLFFGTSLPQRGGRGGVRRAQQQQQKSAAAAASARQGNEINTARRSNALLRCRLVVF